MAPSVSFYCSVCGVRPDNCEDRGNLQWRTLKSIGECERNARIHLWMGMATCCWHVAFLLIVSGTRWRVPDTINFQSRQQEDDL